MTSTSYPVHAIARAGEARTTGARPSPRPRRTSDGWLPCHRHLQAAADGACSMAPVNRQVWRNRFRTVQVDENRSALLARQPPAGVDDLAENVHWISLFRGNLIMRRKSVIALHLDLDRGGLAPLERIWPQPMLGADLRTLVPGRPIDHVIQLNHHARRGA